MKKKLVVLLSLVLVMCMLFCACGKSNEQTSTGESNKQEEPKELSEGEKIAIYAMNKLINKLENPRSLEVYEIKYLCSDGWDYIVCIEYSSNNDLGGREEEEYYLGVTDSIFSDDDFERSNALIAGGQDYSWLDYKHRLEWNWEEKELDIERIMNNLDKVEM